MKVTVWLNASPKYCQADAGTCVFLDGIYAKCKLFDEELDYTTFDEHPPAVLIKRCDACLDTFRENHR